MANSLRPAATDSPHTEPATAWLFDVDGVLTDPERKAITEPAILDELARRLQAGEPVGLNTGRSLDFLAREVLSPLEQRMRDKSSLQNMIAIGERGGVWVVFDADGALRSHVDSSIPASQSLQRDVRALLQRPEFAEVMFYDETKQIMISTELMAGKSVAEYEAPQRLLVAELRELLARHHLERDFSIDPTRIATDLEHRELGKARGARMFVEMLEARGIHPRTYLCFGDSLSDYDMLAELVRLQRDVELIFVADSALLDGEDTRLVTFVRPFFDKGTLRYLQQH
jgi:hydroxymethylpyrimidine pyrophosphatase-like HAD family hydrolase